MSSFKRAGCLMLALALLAACAAPPTPQQAASRAVKRNCEVRADAAAEESRRESAASGVQEDETETRAAEARERAFRSCMLEATP